MAKQFDDDKKKGDSGNTKEDAIEVMATVIEPLPNAMFRVELERMPESVVITAARRPRPRDSGPRDPGP